MSTLRATNIKNPSSVDNNLVLDGSGGVVISGVTTITTLNASKITGVSGGMVVSGVTTVSAGSTSAPSITPSGDENTGIFFPSADTIAFGEGGSEAARFDSSGRLLVGTDTSRSAAITGGGARLQVEGSATEDSFIGVTRNTNSVGGGGIVIGKSRGTTSGSVTAVQLGDYLGFINFEGTDGTNLITGARIDVQVDGTPGSNDMPGRLVFSTTADGSSSPTERMRINAAGNVAFNGTDFSTDNGQVGNLYKFFAGSANPIFAFETTGTNKNACLEYRRTGRSGSARASQLNLGENSSNEGFVSAYSSAANAGVSGGVILSGGATSWASASDIRLKNVVSSFDNALLDVSTIEAFRFTWKSDESATPQVGLSAQSVQAVLPEAVSSGTFISASEDDDTEYLSVRYTEVIPLLVAALQESKQRIETLEASNNDLAARVATLEGN